MERNPYLEGLSEKVRKGEPVGLLQAIAVIDYQEHQRAWHKANAPWARFKRWLKRFLKG